MRADRLLMIMLLLQSHRQMTARSLAERLGVSVRTIQRDMDALSGAGVPVVATRGITGGWSLLDGYRTDLTGLKPEEAQSLLLAGASPYLEELGLGADLETAATKLLAALPGQTRSEAARVQRYLHIDGNSWQQSTETCPHLPVVQEAVWQERCLRIGYARADGIVERKLHPLGLVAKRGVWYVVAAVDDDVRSYRVSRIRAAVLLPERARRPADFDLAAHWEASTAQFQASLPRYAAQLAVTPELLPRLERERYVRVLGDVRNEPTEQPLAGSVPDGWRFLSVEFHTLRHAIWQVLAFAEDAIVLGPDDLRTAVAATARNVARLYDV